MQTERDKVNFASGLYTFGREDDDLDTAADALEQYATLHGYAFAELTDEELTAACKRAAQNHATAGEALRALVDGYHRSRAAAE